MFLADLKDTCHMFCAWNVPCSINKEEWKAHEESNIAQSGNNKVCTAGDVFLKTAEGEQSDTKQRKQKTWQKWSTLALILILSSTDFQKSLFIIPSTIRLKRNRILHQNLTVFTLEIRPKRPAVEAFRLDVAWVFTSDVCIFKSCLRPLKQTKKKALC